MTGEMLFSGKRKVINEQIFFFCQKHLKRENRLIMCFVNVKKCTHPSIQNILTDISTQHPCNCLIGLLTGIIRKVI